MLERLREVGPAAIGISVITWAELRHGAANSSDPNRSLAKLDLFVAPIRVLDFDRRAAEFAGSVRATLQRRGRPIGDMDTLIAAHALSRDLVLVSNNLREFARVDGLRTENWVESA